MFQEYINGKITFDELYKKGGLYALCPSGNMRWCKIEGVKCEDCDPTGSRCKSNDHKCKMCWKNTIKHAKENKNIKLSDILEED